MGFQTRFESLKVHNRCQFARQAVPESGSGVRECSHSYLETKGRQFTGSSHLLLVDGGSRQRLGMFAVGERVSIV